MQNDYGFESFTDEPRMSDEESYTLVSEQNSKPKNNFFKGSQTDRVFERRHTHITYNGPQQ